MIGVKAGFVERRVDDKALLGVRKGGSLGRVACKIAFVVAN